MMRSAISRLAPLSFRFWKNSSVSRKGVERRVDVEVVMTGQALQHLEIELVAPVPALHRARSQRQVREGDDALRIEELDMAEAVAFRAGAHRVVEREQPRLELLQRIAA